ncbi:cellulase-like family protein [Parasediminibacterium sp. JCM 36343]|uniref:cellulase-like family protein n=1 Tax=Parasediminibacterium sp. JCM 36343 TaxID=3374279 RepID=UPI00397A1B15
MNRKDFIKYSSLSSMAVLAAQTGLANFNVPKTVRPLAITMWEFSWLERRWPGGSYEDWDKALDELVLRGYNAVRIDAYPHLIAVDATKEWTLLPVWDIYDWGAPATIKVQVQPSLTQFIAKCKKRNIKVGLSTWYREDVDNTRLTLDTPSKMANNWLAVLDIIKKENLLDAILYVDLCNEWPANVWTPFFKAKRDGHNWSIEASTTWMKETMEIMHKHYPAIPFTFSFDYYEEKILQKNPTPYLDFVEQHVWMASLNNGEFNNAVGINWDGFSTGDLKSLAEKAEPLYKSKPEYWNNILTSSIKQLAADTQATKKPLITTECWGVVNYKDYPMLNWEWEKDLCELGVTTAAATGQWVAIGTSNFCGPQFKGMWADVAWHKKLTGIIKNAPIAPNLKGSKILNRL